MKRINLIIPALALLAVINSGCVTSKAPDGTTTKQIDAQAIATTAAVVHQILSEPAVSNAIYNATAPK